MPFPPGWRGVPSRRYPAQLVAPVHSVQVVEAAQLRPVGGRSTPAEEIRHAVIQASWVRSFSGTSHNPPGVLSQSTGCARNSSFQVGQTAQLRRYLPGQLVQNGRAQLSRLAVGCPSLRVCTRSTGCWRGVAESGWSGCPTPPVSPRSTGSC